MLTTWNYFNFVYQDHFCVYGTTYRDIMVALRYNPSTDPSMVRRWSVHAPSTGRPCSVDGPSKIRRRAVHDIDIDSLLLWLLPFSVTCAKMAESREKTPCRISLSETLCEKATEFSGSMMSYPIDSIAIDYALF